MNISLPILFLFSSALSCSFKSMNYKDVKILWWEGTEVVINSDFLENLKEEEKAVLALISTYAGGECIYENNELNCTLTSALGLGTQCSDKHLSFVKKWFLKDYEVYTSLNDCYSVPYTATNQTKFSEINISRDGINIIVYMNFHSVYSADLISYQWKQKETFELKDGFLYLIEKVVYDEIEKSLNFE